ncbi:PH domain-containing protein [Nocardioides jensenii]|uniref:PH domain-containing protein n=1 Tax=Nocardioides jensenii TaxID=1843 RepID=UPI000835A871|nr:PH domain-containing protein [Nocardioides jensenii]
MAISQKLLNEGEHVIVTTRTHVKALFLPILVLLVTLAAAIYLGTLGDGTTGKVIDIVVWVLAAIVIVWWVVRPFLTWLTTSYTFTNRRFLARSGFIAKEGRTIPLNRISGVDFEISVVDRIFGCGTLVVSDASEQGRVELHDIPRVEQVQLKVADELHRLSEQRNDDGV